jgi:hypothetical protein
MRNRWCRAILSLVLAGVLSPAARSQEHDEAWVRSQIQQIRQSDTTGWARIPWVTSLTEARRLSSAEQAPVFLFTLDGNLETGRC